MSREEVLKKVDIFLLELDPHHHVLDVFDMIECEYTESQLKEFAIDFADYQTKSLKEENKELKEVVKKYIEDRKGVAGLTPVGTDMYNDLHEEIKQAEKLLNKNK
jgi:anion-transporting  ArsA/GET3 family ATPase